MAGRAEAHLAVPRLHLRLERLVAETKINYDTHKSGFSVNVFAFLQEKVQPPRRSRPGHVGCDPLVEPSGPLLPEYVSESAPQPGVVWPPSHLAVVHCEANLEEVQRVQNNGGDHAAAHPRHKVLVPDGAGGGGQGMEKSGGGRAAAVAAVAAVAAGGHHGDGLLLVQAVEHGLKEALEDLGTLADNMALHRCPATETR